MTDHLATISAYNIVSKRNRRRKLHRYSFI